MDVSVGMRVTTYDGRTGRVSHMNDRIVWVVRDGEWWEHPYENRPGSFQPGLT